MYTTGIESGGVLATGAGIASVAAVLNAANMATSTAGAAITPPGTDGASLAATAAQKEDLALFAGYLLTGLTSLAEGQAVAAKHVAVVEADEAGNVASIAAAGM